MKKFTSIVMMLVMLISSFVIAPVTVSAADSDYKYKVLYDNFIEITKYTGKDTEVTIPANIGKYTVLGIGENAFKKKTFIKKVEISEGITYIGDDAFWKCSKLNDITIPESVEAIGKMAFYNTAHFKKDANWENGALYIGDCFVRYKGEAEECIVKEGTRLIVNGAFSYSDVKTVVLPEGLTIIPVETFYQCRKLRSINMPETLIYIGMDAFWGTALKSVDFPESIEYIGERAFNYTDIKSITLPDKYVELGWKVFESTPLYERGKYWEKKGLYIGNHLIEVEEGVKNLEIKKGTKFVCSYVCNDFSSKLKSVKIPDTVEAIGKRAFFFCSELYSVTIPASVTHIGDMAFGMTLIDDKFYRYSDFTIKGIKNSTAHAYAKGYGFDFVDMSAAKSVKLKKTSVTLSVGESCNLKAVVKPAVAGGALKWKSSNKAVAKVNQKGKVTALKKGKVTITVKTANGKTATCKVTVK